MKAGEFVLHSVGTEVRVLEDINSLVTLTEDKNELFQSNQTIRVLGPDRDGYRIAVQHEVSRQGSEQ